jgi:site-specific recombinase XerD
MRSCGLTRNRDADGQSRPISRQQAWYALELAMSRAGMASEHFATHSMRKTSAAFYLAVTKDITKVRDWLGHRSSATTDKYLRSDHRERLIYGMAVGDRIFKLVA